MMKSWKNVVDNLNAENERQGGDWYRKAGISHIPVNPHLVSLMDIIKVAQLLNYRNDLVQYRYGKDNLLWESYCDGLVDVILEATSYSSMKDILINVIITTVGD